MPLMYAALLIDDKEMPGPRQPVEITFRPESPDQDCLGAITIELDRELNFTVAKTGYATIGFFLMPEGGEAEMKNAVAPVISGDTAMMKPKEKAAA